MGGDGDGDVLIVVFADVWPCMVMCVVHNVGGDVDGGQYGGVYAGAARSVCRGVASCRGNGTCCAVALVLVRNMAWIWRGGRGVGG